MTGEIIEVCQDCGHLIEPEIIDDPFVPGRRYKVTLCQRDECLAERLTTAWVTQIREESARRAAAHRWALYTPIVIDPKPILHGLTGI